MALCHLNSLPIFLRSFLYKLLASPTNFFTAVIKSTRNVDVVYVRAYMKIFNYHCQDFECPKCFLKDNFFGTVIFLATLQEKVNL